MVKQTVTLKEVLSIMRGGVTFDIEVCTADGDRSCYACAMMAGATLNEMVAESSSPAPITGHAPGSKVTNPMHAAHGTINIRLTNGDIRKIYPVLIERFNQKIMII